MTRVLVVGGINQDVIVRAEHRARDGETVVGRGPTYSAGGKGANMAVAAARAGAEVALCGVVGDDSPGRDQLEELRREGVDVSAVRTSTDQPTGVALIVVTPDGENSIVVGAGANLDLRLEDLETMLPGAGVALVQAEIGTAATDLAAGVVRDRGARLVLSLAPVSGVAAETWQGADPLVVNEEEAADIAALHGRGLPDDPADLARLLRETTGCVSVVLTLGGEGALLVAGDDVHRIAAPTVEVVDTTGAGDVLAGTLAARLADGMDLLAASTEACAAAARSVTYAGARGRG